MSKNPPGPRELALRAMREDNHAKGTKPSVADLKAATAEAAKKRGKLRKPQAKK